jgi:hypothetical protein
MAKTLEDLLEKSKEVLKSELADWESHLREYVNERAETYATVQDFNGGKDWHGAKAAKHKLKEQTSNVNRIQNIVNKYKKALGFSPREIAATELKRRMTKIEELNYA